MSRYKGDSPAKKIVRALYWGQVRDTLGAERFTNGKHLVLAGRGGDVATLIALGARNVVAVDTDPEACALVERRFPRVTVRNEDVGNAAVREWYDSALLDFCGVIDGPKIMLLRRVIYAQTYGRRDGVVITGCFQSGRDSRVSGNVPVAGHPVLDAEQYSLPNAVESFVARDYARRVEYVANGGKPVVGPEGMRENWLRWFAKNKQLGRRLALSEALTPAERDEWVCLQKGWAQYFSNDRGSGGVPMILSMHVAASLDSDQADCWIQKPQWSLNLLGEKTSPLLRRLALQVDRPALFDILPTQMAAWKAVATRQSERCG